MLKKTFRGLANQEVSSLFKNRKAVSVGNACFRIIADSSSLKRSQFSVIIPKKLLAAAVMRNRLRRQLSEDIRQVYSYWTVGRRVAILVKHGVLKLSGSQRREMLKTLLEDLHKRMNSL